MTTPPTEEFSVGTEAAKFATEFIKSNLGAIYEKTKGIFKFGKEELQLRLESTYRNYFEEVGEKYSKVKTFLINQDSVELYKFYVPLGVTVQRTNYPDVSISELTLTHNFNIITGSAGSGKSMTMRHLFLDSIKERTKVPVFVELRALNDSDLKLMDLIKQTLASFKFDLGDSFIDRALELGHFIFFLDGFDELADEKRKPIAAEIMGIEQINDQNQLVVSSRPDDFFNAWHLFRVWKIDDLTLNKACQLIDSLPFDEETKVKFIKDLRKELFEEHKDFLSNPLLLSIMWLTYSENAAIPEKLTLFYQQAFEALFNKHDAKKGGFQRKRKTKLDIKDFADIFSVFAVQTYDESKVEFFEVEAINFLNRARQVKKLEFSSKDFLTDSIKAVCLILEDGLKLRFAHRSFQEYFSACFILNSDEEIQKRLLSKYMHGVLGNDEVVNMVYLMNPDTVEKLLIIPKIESIELLIDYSGEITVDVVKNYIVLISKRIRLSEYITIDENDEDNFYYEVGYDDANLTIPSLQQLLYDNSELLELAEEKFNVRARINTNLTNAFIQNFGNKYYSAISLEKLEEHKEILSLLIKRERIDLEFIIKAKQILIKKQRDKKESLMKILGI
jgi:hypothetical protein